jgi:hypothetical protein
MRHIDPKINTTAKALVGFPLNREDEWLEWFKTKPACSARGYFSSPARMQYRK